uniref:hypothetical protein n=1 Tax=Sphingomonas populi TaxID=2484750 RepID=UPI0013EE4980|nr:hypothetical protein [Sphingomonas populi]
MRIEQEELAFDQRCYSTDDLVHANSAQTMRFPLSQKSAPSTSRLRFSMSRHNLCDSA